MRRGGLQGTGKMVRRGLRAIWRGGDGTRIVSSGSDGLLRHLVTLVQRMGTFQSMILKFRALR